jgi:hypothetical protein
MKKIIFGLLAITALSANAHVIEGTLVLKGAIKTKIVVNTLKTTCKVKVEKVKNLLVEDSFGNPGYDLRVNMSLDGSDFERSLSVKFEKEFRMNNLFTTGSGTEVRDLEYFSSEGATLNVDKEGRIKAASFPTQYGKINCAF